LTSVCAVVDSPQAGKGSQCGHLVGAPFLDQVAHIEVVVDILEVRNRPRLGRQAPQELDNRIDTAGDRIEDRPEP
jgi:hypothetical protein